MRTSAWNGCERVGAVVLVDAEDRAHAAGVLAHHLVALHLGEPRHFAAQHRHLVARKQVGKDQEPVAVELLELLGAQFHGASSLSANANRHQRQPSEESYAA